MCCLGYCHHLLTTLDHCSQRLGWLVSKTVLKHVYRLIQISHIQMCFIQVRITKLLIVLVPFYWYNNSHKLSTGWKETQHRPHWTKIKASAWLYSFLEFLGQNFFSVTSQILEVFCISWSVAPFSIFRASNGESSPSHVTLSQYSDLQSHFLSLLLRTLKGLRTI